MMPFMKSLLIKEEDGKSDVILVRGRNFTFVCTDEAHVPCMGMYFAL